MNPFKVTQVVNAATSAVVIVNYIMARCWFDAKEYALTAFGPGCEVSAVEALPEGMNPRDIPQAPFRPKGYERSVDTAELHRKEGRQQIRELIQRMLDTAHSTAEANACDAILAAMDRL